MRQVPRTRRWSWDSFHNHVPMAQGTDWKSWSGLCNKFGRLPEERRVALTFTRGSSITRTVRGQRALGPNGPYVCRPLYQVHAQRTCLPFAYVIWYMRLSMTMPLNTPRGSLLKPESFVHARSHLQYNRGTCCGRVDTIPSWGYDVAHL